MSFKAALSHSSYFLSDVQALAADSRFSWASTQLICQRKSVFNEAVSCEGRKQSSTQGMLVWRHCFRACTTTGIKLGDLHLSINNPWFNVLPWLVMPYFICEITIVLFCFSHTTWSTKCFHQGILSHILDLVTCSVTKYFPGDTSSHPPHTKTGWKGQGSAHRMWQQSKRLLLLLLKSAEPKAVCADS